MHDSVMEFLRRHVAREEICGRRVLEVGSYNINGSPRSIIKPMLPSSYIGVDQTPGPGVDIICRSEELTSVFSLDSFDIVISTEMLEHCREWKPSISAMKAVLKPGGLLVVTTRSPGFKYHPYPEDHWRFTTEDFSTIFSDMERVLLLSDWQPGHPGVFLKAFKPSIFSEVSLSGMNVERAPNA